MNLKMKSFRMMQKTLNFQKMRCKNKRKEGLFNFYFSFG